MLITPLMAGIGGLVAFFAVVFVVVWLPIHTFDPPPSNDWAPLSNAALAGRNLFASNGCYVCHSGYSRPQDVREALYFLYPKVSQPGDFWGSDQSPNLLGTERTGPDLSQEWGWHPNDWQYAHFYDPRYMDPKSLMPDMKSLFYDSRWASWWRSSSSGAASPACCVTPASCMPSTSCSSTRAYRRPTGASRARTSRSSSAAREQA